MFLRQLAHQVFDLIRWLRLQVAGLNIHYFIKHTRCMETKGRFPLNHLTLGCIYLFLCQVMLGGEGKLQFIPVKFCAFATADRHNLWQFHITDTTQLIGDLLLFIFRLFMIREHLPFTAATYAEMLAKRLNTLRCRAFDLHHFCLCITFFIF
ncbi:hypothetical protein D3C72_1846710 [compost metagenome]